MHRLISSIRPRFGAFLLCGLVLLLAGPWAAAAERPAQPGIASAHPLATQAGLEVLREGGNAFDAAVAVTAALAVVEPYSSGLGGGGFWLLHRARDGYEVMIDGRERAPLAAHSNLYLDKQGNVIPGKSINGPLAAGIPGEPAAIVHLAEKYGRLPLTKSLAPAIRLAEHGFKVDRIYHRMAVFRLNQLMTSPAASRVFLPGGKVPAIGTLIRQPDLAATLRAIALHGRKGFYSGRVARHLIAGVRHAGGIWTQKDLDEYRVVERKPIVGRYHDIRVVSASPPSSGGIVLMEMLNILSGYHLDMMDRDTRFHVIIEAMRRAYRDRAQYLGDPDFVKMPEAMLLSPYYAAGLRASIRLDHATPSSSLPGAVAKTEDSPDTTHFSIIDKAGNRVAATLSINYPFGSCFMPANTGVLLNDEMDDFSAKPGVPNVYGLIGGHANAIAPGKRPLSSMSPTFLDDGKRVVALGTPGGSRIITMVLLATLDFAQGGDPHSMVAVPRFHHQFLPDEVQYEPYAFSQDDKLALQLMGHRLKALDETYGNMQVVMWNRRTGEVEAASDPRGIGAAWPRPAADGQSTGVDK
ncbi:MAG: gamma-glutamyltransferase [Gammaproteobacteria bacterium]